LTITYNVTVTDNTGASLTQPVTITITGSNDAPVLAADASGPHGTAQAVHTSGALTFTDVNLNDHHTVSTSVTSTTWPLGVTAPSGIDAGLAGAVSATTADSTGSGSGLIVFTFGAGDALDFLAAGQKLTITYNVTVTDGSGGSSTQLVTITVIGTNDAPVAVADVAAVKVDTPPNPVSGNLLANDTDVDILDTHTVSAVANGTDNGTTITVVGIYGTLVVTKATGAYTYTLANGQANVQALAEGQRVTDVFTYTNSDNHGGSSSSTLTVTVTGTDDAPALSVVAAGHKYTNTAVTLLSAASTTVSDVDNQTLQSATVMITDFVTGDVLSANVAGTNIKASYANGVLTLSGNDTLANYKQVLNSVTYSSTSADPSNSGTDTSRTISWVVNDGTLLSATQTTT